MPKALLVLLAATFSLPLSLPAQNEKLTTENLAQFLARFEETLRPIDQAYTELENENQLLRDETGHPLVRRRILDRRLVIQTEALADDLFDLAQTAYDNDREDWGKRLSDLESVIDHNSDLVEAYVLDFAALKQQRINELEKENQTLQEKLRKLSGPGKKKSSKTRRSG
jgi:hypothetical protein